MFTMHNRPLSGALLYVAQSGDLLTGGIALYALAMGMGIPLILVAVFGNKLLPKAGGWMDRVKTLFGFVLLATPIFLLERILPPVWSMAIWSGFGFAFFVWLYHIKRTLPFGGWKQSLVSIVAVLGLLFSAQPIFQQFMIPEAKKFKLNQSLRQSTTLRSSNNNWNKPKRSVNPSCSIFTPIGAQHVRSSINTPSIKRTYKTN